MIVLMQLYLAWQVVDSFLALAIAKLFWDRRKQQSRLYLEARKPWRNRFLERRINQTKPSNRYERWAGKQVASLIRRVANSRSFELMIAGSLHEARMRSARRA